MKKLLLTLGSAAAIVAPITSVIACGSDEETTSKGSTAVADGTLTMSGFEGPKMADESEAEMNKTIDFINSMGLKIMGVSGKSNITKVVLKGKIASEKEANALVDIDETVDFAKVPGMENLQDAYDIFDGEYEEGDDFTASGTLFSTLISGKMESEDIAEIPADVTTVTISLNALEIASTHMNDDNYDGDTMAITAEEAETSFGIVAAEFAKIEALLVDGLTFNKLAWDADAEKLIVEFAFSGKNYDATLSGFTFATA